MRTEQEVVAAFERLLARSRDPAAGSAEQAKCFNQADALAWALGGFSWLEERLAELAAPSAGRGVLGRRAEQVAQLLEKPLARLRHVLLFQLG